MERPFPKSTLVVALCLSTSNLIAHAAGLAALLHDDHKASRIFQRHQTLYSAVAFCSIVLALVIAESPNTNASPELPLAWYFFSVALSEGERRQILTLGSSDESEISLSLTPLLVYVRPLSLFYAVAPKRYYLLFTLVPTIVEFSFSCYKTIHWQHTLHIYRCPMVALSMLALLVASLVTTFRKFDQSGLISGLTIDVLLFLTLPFHEPWSKDTWQWWVEKCSGSSKENMAVRTSLGGDRSESLRELQRSRSRKSSAASRDIHSVRESSIGMESNV